MQLGLITINALGMAAAYSTILTALYAVPDKLWESPLLFQMPGLTSLCHLRSEKEDKKTKMEHRKEQRNCCQKLFLPHLQLQNLFSSTHRQN